MLDRIQKRKESGFTIVEVMIVLAIAGLIILVVFLAVPALQRNSRNQQRTNDVAMISAGVNECLNNRNGIVGSCDAWTGELNQYIDNTKFRQIGTAATSVTTSGGALAGTITPPTATDQVIISFRVKCDAAGAQGVTTGANARSVAILFAQENTSGNAVGRCQEI